MAESNLPNEGDSHFKHPIQAESENSGEQLLLQIQLDEQQSQDVPERLQGNNHRDIHLEGLRSPSPIRSGRLYRGEGQRSPNRIVTLEQKENPTDVSDDNGDCFQKPDESDAKSSSQIIGLLSGTTIKMYPHTAGIVATCYGICFGKTQKPKFIDHEANTVIVYDPLQLGGQFHPPVLSFTTENGRENEFDVD